MPLEHFKHERPREYEELKEAGKLDERVFEKEFSKDNMRVIHFLGIFGADHWGSLILAIVYTLISGGGH